MQMQLIFIGLGGVQHLHVGVLHADSKPLASGAIPQGEDLRAEVVLLELLAFAQIPAAHSVVQSAGPELGTVGGDVDTGGAIGVALKLAD